MSFSTALENLKETGRFQLINHQLCSNKLAELTTILASLDGPLRIDLNNVELVSSKTEELPKEQTEHLLSGAAYEHKLHWIDKLSDFQIHQWHTQTDPVSTRRFNPPIKIDHDKIEQVKFQDEQKELEQILLNLLNKSKWQVIRLEKIIFNWRGVKQALNYEFMTYFFRSRNITQLKELSIKNMRINSNELIHLLARNTHLTHLIYWTSYFDKAILEIADHPNLTELDLGNALLDITNYSELNALLDKNYRIEKIYLQAPKSEPLNNLYRKIMQRLEKKPEERFKKEHLTQTKLLALAEKYLTIKSEFLPLVLKYPPGAKAISYSTEQRENAYQLWPHIYKAHRSWINNDSTLIQLDMQEKLETNPSISIGGYLLSRASIEKNEISTSHLLKAGANPLEKVGEASLLMRVLKDKQRSPWGNVVITYVRQGLSVLSPQLSQLSEFIKLYQKIKEISDHLSNYLGKLDNRNHKAFFIQLITGIFFRIEERKLELENALNRMVDLINAGTKETEMTTAKLKEMSQFAHQLRKDAQEARKGLTDLSELNDDLVKMCSELIAILKELKKDLQRKEMREELKKEQPEEMKKLQEEIKTANEKLKENKIKPDDSTEELEKLKEITREMKKQIDSIFKLFPNNSALKNLFEEKKDFSKEELTDEPQSANKEDKAANQVILSTP